MLSHPGVASRVPVYNQVMVAIRRGGLVSVLRRSHRQNANRTSEKSDEERSWTHDPSNYIRAISNQPHKIYIAYGAPMNKLCTCVASAGSMAVRSATWSLVVVPDLLARGVPSTCLELFVNLDLIAAGEPVRFVRHSHDRHQFGQ